MKEKVYVKQFQSKVLKKILTLLVVTILILPSICKADVLVSQTTHDGFKSGTGFYIQTLGTGLSGTVDSIDLYVFDGSATKYTGLWECTSSSYTSCTEHRTESLATTPGINTYDFSTPYELNPDAWYYIDIDYVGFDMSGNTEDNYANGQGLMDCETHTIVGCTPTNTIEDFYFILNGTPGEEIPPTEPEFVDPALFASPGLSMISRASSTCYQIGTTTPYTFQCNASSTPVYVQDAGNVSIGLAILITMQSLMLVGYTYNTISNKRKQWH